MAEGRAWIRDLRPGAEVDETYAVRARDLRQRRGGGPFLALTLVDRTGEIAGLVWENVDQLASEFVLGGVVRVRGQVQRYNQRLQLVVRRAEAAEAGDVDERDYVRASSLDPVIMWRRLETLIEELADPHLTQLLFRVFSDPDVAERFRVAPAARSLHHGFRSGLLEHTLSVTTAARILARHYRLDESLVVAGCLLHDLGKIWELEAGASIEYTDDGRLLGHLPMEVLYVDRQIGELEEFPAETRRQLLHILLAHHGEYEYGSPRRPKTPEALLVHMADNLDSKLAGMLEAIAADGGDDEAWTAYSRILERHVYRRPAPTSNASNDDE